MRPSTLGAVGEILDGLGIEWAVFGALAANLYRAETRLTQDVDLLLAESGAGSDELEAALRRSGWDVRRAIPDGTLLRARHPEHGVVDLVRAQTPYQAEAMARSRPQAASEGRPVRVLAVEDVILHKLIAARSRDVADVESILAAALPMDESYLERWAREWDVWNTLRELRAAAAKGRGRT